MWAYIFVALTMRSKKSLKNKLRKSVDQAPIFNLWPRGVSVFMASSFIKDFHTRCHYPSRMFKPDDSSKKSTEILFFVFLMPKERLIVVYRISLVRCYLLSFTSAWKLPSYLLSSNMLTTRVFVDVFSKIRKMASRHAACGNRVVRSSPK